MTYRNRYRLIYTLLLTALLAGGSITAMAQGSGTSTGVVVRGNVYGGGNLADVKTNTEVNMSTGTVKGNVFGGGKGTGENSFTCDKAMVGTEVDSNACEDPGSADNKDKGTKVTISNGTVGTLEGTGENQTLKEGTGNVYGGGEIGRVEWNTQVLIGVGTGNGTFAPVIYGSVFGAGKGLETHGYSALVRGNSTVTVQGNAKIGCNVYGGGEKSTVGRYWVKDIPATSCEGETQPTAPTDLPTGMPYLQRKGGYCSVTIQGNAEIGYAGATDEKGHVFGAGKGVNPHFVASGEGLSQKMVKGDTENPDRLVNFTATTGQTAEEAYLEFLQTLALVTNTNVTIDGSAKVKGSVLGGSENGFVQTNTNVTIQGSCEIGTTTYGNVYGGGKGLPTFAEAGKVKGNTAVTIIDGTVNGNVYGGGSLGDVGTITKPADYNYTWKKTDGTTANTAGNNGVTYAENETNKNTGVCTVTISGGEIGISGTVSSNHGNVFGAGKGADDTFWCEKAMAFATNVSVSAGIVYGNVYGGGQIGRVEDDAKVTIGLLNPSGTDVAPNITGSVFGAGAGVETHGYSALVRGNTAVTVQGYAQVGKSVYGGGETASVGRYGLNSQKMPNILVGGGKCEVKVQGHATIVEDVFGACKGVATPYNNEVGNNDRCKRMVTYDPNRETNPHVTGNRGSFWDPYGDDEDNPIFVWEYFTTPTAYSKYLETLALATHPEVTISGDATVNGSVYGGGELGLTKGSVIVSIQGGTIEEDVYGGGALADTNTTSEVANNYPTTTPETNSDGSIKTKEVSPTTTVNLLGGLVKGNAYGGGLGQLGEAIEGVHYAADDPEVTGGTKTTDDWKVEPVSAADGAGSIKAMVHGDINVNLGSSDSDSPATAFRITYETDDSGNSVVKSGRVFGCNNLNGSPLGDVRVTVYKTVTGKDASGGNVTRTPHLQDNVQRPQAGTGITPSYELAAVYGGGNLADYTTAGKKAYVKIMKCDVSVQSVYGGGNAAAVPETDVLVYGAYEIGEVFGGGNGKDKYKLANSSTWNINPGANVNGNATTLLKGGYIHEAYGGSNSKGTISGDVSIDKSSGGDCTLTVVDLYGAGKDADIEGDLIMVMGCSETRTENIYGCSKNANVKGNVELTITSGEFGKVFGGNNESGSIFGHIIVNIEEVGCSPIIIDELYGCGNDAAYSVYGYYEDGTTASGKPNYVARESLTDHTAVTFEGKPHTVPPYADPEVNIISCTRIGKVFGGGLGSNATVYGNPKVNINMIKGVWAGQTYGTGANAVSPPDQLGAIGGGYTANNQSIEGGVFGGGNQAAVYGNTTVNIGTEENVYVVKTIAEGVSLSGYYTFNGNTREYETATGTAVAGTTYYEQQTVQGANIAGNVYGGGNLADVGKTHTKTETVDGKPVTTDIIEIESCTFVNICAVKGAEIAEQGTGTGRYNYTSVSFAEGAPGVTILGNVYGGGKGEALPSGDGSFRCGKAMVTKNTNVAICNGTIGNGTTGGAVYGGGQVGRVEKNTVVTIGSENDTNSAPVIMDNVFGAGEGVNTHGYSALARGNSYVTIQGESKVKKSVYGGGKIASVGKYNVNAQGLPESLANQGSGYCTVIVRDNAVIGPDEEMIMTRTGGPDDYGHVFGAGKGVLPYEGYAPSEKAWRTAPTNVKQDYLSMNEAISGTSESDYLTYVETLGLATQTYVTIDENAFVKGSVYGGSENGYVQHDTQVNIQGNCQIGNGYVQMTNEGIYLNKLETPETPMGVNRPFTAAEWAAGKLIPDQTKEPTLYALVNEKYYTSSLPECASWPYGQTTGDDKFASWDKYDGTTGYNSVGGRSTADDGHTFYGNVFGGGSGCVPYRPGKWHPEAGSVAGNAVVNITGGHILTNIYGGNELTDVKGKCTITMSGGTLGVPRTLRQIGAHPVTCYLFGAGKGDPRVLFNKATNVEDVEVNITGGTIYGSVFGGGEDGHVLRDVKMTIGTQTTTGTGVTTSSGPTIGTWGTSYVDGNVFGGGRGFTGDAYTAGNVAGSVKMEIKGGSILGSIYGGGRLGSVGYGLFDAVTNNQPTSGYGEMRGDDDTEEGFSTEGFFTKGRGHIDITISGGTIGNNREYIVPNATNMAAAGIPEAYRDISKWNETNKYWDTWKTHHNIPKTEFDEKTGQLKHTKGGNVFAGGMGNFYKQDGETAISDINWWQLGCVKSTKLTISGDAIIMSNVYGGGELGLVVGIPMNAPNAEDKVGTEVNINGGTIGTEVKDGSNVVQYTFGSVFGGGYGSLKETLGSSYPKYIAGRVKAGTKVNMTAGRVWASIYGGGEMAAVGESKTLNETPTTGFTGDTHVAISGGTIGKEKVGTTYFGGAKMGNVYGGGSGHNNTVRSGHVYGNTNVTISAGSVSGEPKIYHNVYGGGAYGTVGDFTYDMGPDSQTGTNKVTGISDLHEDHTNTGVATVTITGGTIGIDGKENGMVFGSSRGDINRPEERDDYTAWVYNANVTIGTAGTPASGTEEGGDYVAAIPASGPEIKGSVYGSGENGHTFNNTVVTVNGGKIGIDASSDPGYTVTSNGKEYSGADYPYRGNVYGGGCGTDKYYSDHDEETHDGNGQLFNPLAGIVYGNTNITITGGHIVRNVYGAGAMGSVGHITSSTKNESVDNGFGLSWPYKFEYALDATSTEQNTVYTGKTTIDISGDARIGCGGDDDGNVYGAARGSADVGEYDIEKQRYEEALLANVRETEVKVHYDTTPTNLSVASSTGTGACITGSVFGGGEDGHVYENAKIEITGGLIGHSVYGGGKGKGTYPGKLKEITGNHAEYETDVASWIAGKIYGNTWVKMTGGHVIRNVYGGGNLGSVGKGNYAGGAGDYYPAGYGERITTALSENTDFMGSGKAKVEILGGTVGTADGEEAGLATGNVFGSSRGRTAADVGPLSPRYEYAPDFFLGYCNETEVIIGTEATGTVGGTDYVAASGPTIYGSVYGGGRDGHVRRETKVTINEGTIGVPYTDTTALDLATTTTQWRDRGNVYGSGSGLGTYVTKVLKNNSTTDYVEFTRHGTSSGSVTDNTTVDIKGGTIYQNVYGGGALSSVGPPRLGQTEDPQKTITLCKITIEGGQIGTENGWTQGYGGSVYGASRGGGLYTFSSTEVPQESVPANESADKYATTCYTEVNMNGGTVWGDVYGGGEAGIVKHDTDVNLMGGVIKHDAYGGGRGTTTIAANVGNVTVDLNGTTTVSQSGGYTGTPIGGVDSNENTAKGCVVGRVFGCNNVNGTPKGSVLVYVHATQRAGAANVAAKTAATKNSNGEYDFKSFDVEAVYGGGNLAAYEPTKAITGTAAEKEEAKTVVIIDGCYLTSIGQVYGGGNAASVSATDVTVNGAKEIGEVFGGGNGKDDVSYDSGVTIKPNPGANVGYRNYSEHYQDGTVWKVRDMAAYDTKEEREAATDPETGIVYGTGKTQVTIYGGNVHAVYGGSNTKGNVRVASVALLDGETNQSCDFNVDEAYGGGKNADMDGTATLIMNCIQGMKEVYGGAEDADVLDNVTLNITNGTFDQVFGGNNKGGRVAGSITVNVEETGCKPVIIGELYGGGNLAGYSIYGYKQVNGKWRPRTSDTDDGTGPNTPYASPVVNVKSFTGIGNIFGGGYGQGAVMVADPTVNINVVKGRFSDKTSAERFTVKGYVLEDDPNNSGKKRYSKTIGGNTVYVPEHEENTIGAIYNVFGGGNAAEVIGTPHVNIGTLTGEVISLVSKPIEDSEGKTPSQDGWTPSYEIRTVEGVDIRGNVFGGGNEAAVTGDTKVVIGKNDAVKTYSFTSFDAASGGNVWSSGLAQTTGETKNGLAEVVILTNGKYGDFVGQKYYVSPNATANGTARTELMDASGNGTSLYVAIKPFEQKKTYSFTSWSASTGGTEYSSGTAAPTGNFKIFNNKEYMQIEVLTNGEASWVGRTFYVPVTLGTGETRYRLHNAEGNAENVWVTITE